MKKEKKAWANDVFSNTNENTRQTLRAKQNKMLFLKTKQKTKNRGSGLLIQQGLVLFNLRHPSYILEHGALLSEIEYTANGQQSAR